MSPTTTAVVALLTLLAAQATPAPRARVRVSVSLAEYYGTIYVRPPSGGADHVLLRGEPLLPRLSIVNSGSEQEVRLRPSQSAPFSLHVSAIGSAEALAQGVVELSAVRRGAGAPGPVALPVRLKPRESLHWDATVPDFSKLAAGRYRVQAHVHVESSPGGTPEVNSDHLVIELRDIAGRAERVESLRIAATRALSNNGYAQADAAARRLLAEYPQSAFAYMLIGDAAVPRRDAGAARAAYAKALELLRSGGDTVFAAVATAHQVSETIGAVDTRMAALAR